MARDEDAMLVESCLRGDRHAFDKLVDRYEGPIYSAAYRITGSVEDAMDATQNAFVNAYEKLHTFDPNTVSSAGSTASPSTRPSTWWAGGATSRRR